MALLFLCALAYPCRGQDKYCTVGIGLTSFLNGCVDISTSYSYAKHWSVMGEASISYKGLARRKSSIELEHDEEFASTPTPDKSPDTHCERFLFSYWPSQAFQGFSLSAGLQSGSSSGIDILSEVGYTFTIWNRVYLNTGIRIPIRAAIRQGNINAENIIAKINYRF